MKIEEITVSQTQIYSARSISVYEVPMASDIGILHVEQIVLRFGNYGVDVGALCYLRRSQTRRTNSRDASSARLVDLTSFNKVRAKQIESMIQYVSDLVVNGGYRLTSVHSFVTILCRFIDWSDSTGHGDVLSGTSKTYDAFRAYVLALKEKVKRNEIVHRTAASQQFKVLKFLAGWLGLHDLHRGVNLLSLKHAAENPTEPPSEDNLGRVVSLCEALFKGFGDLVLNKELYPYWLPMPKYLSWSDGGLWVFPLTSWCIPPYYKEQVFTNYAYDFRRGKLNNPDDIIQNFTVCERNVAVTAVRKAERQISQANSDPQNYWRIKGALRAHHAFLMMFLGQTGMNLAVVLALPWGEQYTVGTAQQGFREIKWRAGGKLCSIVIRMKFLPLFSRFIELRNYILNGRACNYLFLSLGGWNKHDPMKMSNQTFYAFYMVLQYIDPSLTKIFSRKFRAAKDDYHIRHDDITMTSKIMGRTEETTRKSYASGTKTDHYNEMGMFLDRVKQAAINKEVVLTKNQIIPNGTEGHIGLCAKINDPNPIVSLVPVQPDCKKYEGCLFCDKHRVHSDEKDTRKLASCAFVVKQVIYVPGSETYFQPVLERIESLLEEVKSRELGNAEMVDRVVHSVEIDGELDPYWMTKLALLESLEFVI